ncbi:Signal transduction histidine kinase [Rubellimicrobium thermophilum DSM 16684]|uniref:histidine kinase n=1 Tax=Rubellimicrobium thermophilum DSM 16684 TaxID=1123069 RepID=S9S0P0_9RHOB|nr:PAS domain-containing sensor histidine kinase [Rubellimicrobium thermophilum]EPX83800.1 Signal transduction histidine kinase [Rubellimicrobium thermophilum DSM 16684]
MLHTPQDGKDHVIMPQADAALAHGTGLSLAHDLGFVAGIPGGAAGGVGLAVSLLSALPDCVKLLDLDGRLIAMSHAGLCLMEIDDFGAIRGCDWWTLWPSEAEDQLRRAVARARAGETARFTAFCPTAKGTPKWWEVTVAPIRQGKIAEGADGVTALLSVSRDVTAQMEALQEIETRRAEAEVALAQSRLLLREIDHRVKNSLMLIVGLLRMQARQSAGEAEACLSEAAQRVLTVAAVHDQLYRAEMPDAVLLDDYLGHLCTDLAAALRNGDGARIETTLAPLSVTPDRAVALGLILAEVVANAFRHARLGPDNAVHVRLAAEGPGRAQLVVEDDGCGMPERTGQSGLGTRVVLSKAGEIGGEARWSPRQGGGTVFTLDFPLA